MPHLVILYTPNLEGQVDMDAVCRDVAGQMLKARDEEGRQVFPSGGIRVLAYPAAHFAVADGKRDYAFVYMNLRMGRGRSAEAIKRAGEAIFACAKRHFEPLLEARLLGVTFQVDEGKQVFDARLGNIHPLFRE